MTKQKLNPTDRKQQRSISLTLNEMADIETRGGGSLSAGVLHCLRKTLELETQLQTLNEKGEK